MTEDFENEQVDPEEAALEAEFASLLKEHMPKTKRGRPGEVMDGTVVQIVDDQVMINYGAREEGSAPLAEFRDARGDVSIAPGQSVRVVLRGYDDEGRAKLGAREVREADARRMLADAHAAKLPVRGTVVSAIKGGLLVDVGLSAFLPASQVDVFRVENLDSMVGQQIEAYVEELDESKGRAVLSRRRLLAERRDARKGDFLAGLTPGQVLHGRVRTVVDFGVFVDFDGVEGLLPRAEISYDRGAVPAELFSAGQEIEVKVLEVQVDSGRLTLSRKRLMSDPWDNIKDRFPVGTVVSGRVTGVQSFGAFVQLEEGVTGLIHIKDVAWNTVGVKCEERFAVGDMVNCQVAEIDLENKKLALSLKHLSRDPWLDLEQRCAVGTRHRGTVVALLPFGAVVRIDANTEGLVHISEMSWEKRINSPSEVVSEGQEVDVVVLKLDREKHRLSLGMKQVTNSPFLEYVAANVVGSRVKGSVKRFLGFGAVVELAPGVEGLLHVSEIAEERVESAERALRVGEEVVVKILSVDEGKQRISLSRRAALREVEHENISQYTKKAAADEKAAGGGLLGDAFKAALKNKKK